MFQNPTVTLMLPEEVGVWGWGEGLPGIGRNSGLKQSKVLLENFSRVFQDSK